MKGIKILHFADVHFDTPFSEGGNEFSQGRKEDIRETFSNILERAKNESVKIILIPGDFFDNTTLTKTTLEFIKRKLEEVKPIRVFISPGNHDPFNEKSFYSIIEWPSNVHIFKEEFEKIHIEELNCNIFGKAFTQNHIKESMLKEFLNKYNLRECSEINIMVLHGDINDKAAENDYNPISLEEIGNSYIDYLALGHRHSFSGIRREKNTYFAYSGNPEGRGFDETGEKGVIIGEIFKGYVDLKFNPICKRKYYTINLNITDSKDYEDICNKINESISFDDKKNNLYKIILIGEISDHFIINIEVLKQKIIDSFYYVKIQDNTEIYMDYENLSKEVSIKGIYTRNMLNAIENEKDKLKKEKLYKALKVGIQSLTEREVKVE